MLYLQFESSVYRNLLDTFFLIGEIKKVLLKISINAAFLFYKIWRINENKG
jgi:hypothetical protein